MDGTIVISVSRAVRPREVLLRRVMAVLAVVFLLQAIMFSTGFMLPCFLMTLCYFWFSHASKREYEYTLADGVLKIKFIVAADNNISWLSFKNVKFEKK